MFYWGNSNENCLDLLVHYIRKLRRGIESRRIPGRTGWNPHHYQVVRMCGRPECHGRGNG